MIWRRALPWLVLALPAAAMIAQLARGEALSMDLLHPTGALSLRLMLLAMLPGPLADFFGRNRFLAGWIALRRDFGLAAFAYAALHLAFYAADMASLAAIADELGLPAIWTGWLALALMVPAAATSRDRAMRALKRAWKRWQRLVWAAFALGLAHWVLLDREWRPAALHLAPLLLAWSLRLAARFRHPAPERIA